MGTLYPVDLANESKKAFRKKQQKEQQLLQNLQQLKKAQAPPL
jgi:hypothetical protein